MTNANLTGSRLTLNPKVGLRLTQDPYMDSDPVIIFACEAIGALREQAYHLHHQPRSDRFFLILTTHLEHVQERLGMRDSLSIERVIRLLGDLERLATMSSHSSSRFPDY